MHFWEPTAKIDLKKPELEYFSLQGNPGMSLYKIPMTYFFLIFLDFNCEPFTTSSLTFLCSVFPSDKFSSPGTPVINSLQHAQVRKPPNGISFGLGRKS